ncbi:hypothetical protein [Alistipes indistinctus]|jgi:hypothetical protein|uniref:hypothetical protein n=1 Tax=Alistipes indistinctus TaxID=626932 RepID=UPI00242C29EC|nr:hypothetical protein [Alistipes indistinctus]
MSKAKEFIRNLFTYIGDYNAASPDNVTYVEFNNTKFSVQIQPFFELNTSHGKVIARSQIIDGEEAFERMSIKTSKITFRGTILVDKWRQRGFDDLGRGAVQIATDTKDWNDKYRIDDMLEALDLINRQVFQVNEIIEVKNPYLNKLGIEYILVESMTTNPLIGSVGFEYSIEAYDATSKKNNKEETLIISQ